MFAETHQLALALVRQGLVDGLRVDHPDGLADPAGYLERLRDAGVEHVWVEKILDPGERLRDWPVEGTVGYEFLNDVVRAVRRPGRRGAADRAVGRAVRRRAPVRRLGGRGQARAGADHVRAGRRVAAAALARRRGRRGGACRAAGLPHLHPRPAGARGPARAARGGADRVACRGAARVRDALPADHAADHGQGRRGHGVLPLRAAARAVRRRRRPEPLVDRRADVPRGQRRARRALPAAPAVEPDARHEALGRRARADRRARRDGGRVGGGGAALARAVRAVARRRRPRRGRGVHDLPDARGRLAARAGAPVRVHEQGDARGQAQHELGRAGRRLGGARARLLPRPVRARAVPRRLRAVRGAARGRGRAARAAPDGAEADRAGRARHLPGRRAGRALAGRPRQPPPGRLGAPARAARRAARGSRHAQALADPRAAGAARAPPGRVRGVLRAARRGAGRGRVHARRRRSRSPCRSAARSTSLRRRASGAP